MLDKLWSSLEHVESKSVQAELLAWTYFNSPGIQIKDIRSQFDSWSLQDFKDVYDRVEELPPLEGEAWYDNRFGVIDWVSRIEFYEGANLQILPDFFWFEASKSKTKNKFF